MDTNDFYEEDESPEEFAAAWRAGVRGVTAGPKRLSPEAQAVVDEAVRRLDEDA